MKQLIKNKMAAQGQSAGYTHYTFAKKEIISPDKYAEMQQRGAGILVPCAQVYYNGKARLLYDVQGLRLLEDMLPEMNEQDFCVLLTNTLQMVSFIQDAQHLAMQDIEYTAKAIYINENKQAVWMYLPVIEKYAIQMEQDSERTLRDMLCDLWEKHPNVHGNIADAAIIAIGDEEIELLDALQVSADADKLSVELKADVIPQEDVAEQKIEEPELTEEDKLALRLDEIERRQQAAQKRSWEMSMARKMRQKEGQKARRVRRWAERNRIEQTRAEEEAYAAQTGELVWDERPELPALHENPAKTIVEKESSTKEMQALEESLHTQDTEELVFATQELEELQPVEKTLADILSVQKAVAERAIDKEKTLLSEEDVAVGDVLEQQEEKTEEVRPEESTTEQEKVVEESAVQEISEAAIVDEEIPEEKPGIANIGMQLLSFVTMQDAVKKKTDVKDAQPVDEIVTQKDIAKAEQNIVELEKNEDFTYSALEEVAETVPEDSAIEVTEGRQDKVEIEADENRDVQVNEGAQDTCLQNDTESVVVIEEEQEKGALPGLVRGEESWFERIMAQQAEIKNKPLITTGGLTTELTMEQAEKAKKENKVAADAMEFARELGATVKKESEAAEAKEVPAKEPFEQAMEEIQQELADVGDNKDGEKLDELLNHIFSRQPEDSELQEQDTQKAAKESLFTESTSEGKSLEDIFNIPLQSEEEIKEEEFIPSIRLVGINTPEPLDILIDKASFVIGKKAKVVDAVITFSGVVSRRHCEVVREAGTDYLIDLGSVNGTFLNNERLDTEYAVEIRSGDTLRLANVTFSVVKA